MTTLINETNFPDSIGIFDSGVGGLTVLKQLIRALPHENFVYFGDTARLPYGDKSRETIINYSIENTHFLLEKKIKMLVVACNTASAFALDSLTQMFPIPIIGPIDPGAELALQTSKTKRIAVLGTRGTVSSKAFEHAILSKCPSAYVLSIACPLLVPLVEEHFIDHPATQLILNDYLKPIREHEIDTIVLGCTHYPLLAPLIQSIVTDSIRVVDCATACAQTVKSILQANGMEGTHQESICQFYVSDDPLKFERIGQKFLEKSFKAQSVTAYTHAHL